jgi:hypothetical protein
LQQALDNNTANFHDLQTAVRDHERLGLTEEEGILIYLDTVDQRSGGDVSYVLSEDQP